MRQKCSRGETKRGKVGKNAMDKDEKIARLTQKIKEKDRQKGRWKIERQTDETLMEGKWKSVLRLPNECRKAKKKM